jgi:hypothetical protein
MAYRHKRARFGNAPGDAKPLAPQGKRLGALALAMIAIGTLVVLASDLFFKYWPNSSPSRETGASDARSSPAGPPAALVETASTDAKPSLNGTKQVEERVSPTGEAKDRVQTGSVYVRPSYDSGQPTTQFSEGGSQSALPSDMGGTLLPSLAVRKAKQLLNAGHIAAARELLLQPALAESQEAAWLVARSFDPNYLATLQSPDAEANRGKAEQWYRRWHEIGAQMGQVTEEGRLKQLIDAMR